MYCTAANGVFTMCIIVLMVVLSYEHRVDRAERTLYLATLIDNGCASHFEMSTPTPKTNIDTYNLESLKHEK